MAHPAISGAIENAFINLDYPIPLDDPWCMGSKGIGHGTAMAGLIAGRTDAKRLGVAPGAKVLPVRCANLARDDHDDRFELGVALLGVGLNGSRAMPPHCTDGAVGARIAAVVLSLDFQRPDYARAEYLTAEQIETTAGKGELEKLIDAASDGEGPACDPFALAILLVQNAVAVVIPSGNGGGNRLAYPGSPDDYAAIVALLKHPDGRAYVFELLVDMISSYNAAYADAENSADIRNALRDSFDTFVSDELSNLPLFTQAAYDTGDPFADTGIIVVGAANYDDAPDLDPAEMDRSAHHRAGYSQYGPGLCVLAPSDQNTNPPYRCDGASGDGSTPVPTADLRGPGGFASDPMADTSHAGQIWGFGGTSAASAKVGGVIALLAERQISQTPDLPLTGPGLRAALIGHVTKSVPYEQAGAWLRRRGPDVLLREHAS